MAVLKKEYLSEYTYDDYQQWAGDWELIKGIPDAMVPAPVKKHQMLVGYIFSEIAFKMNDCPDCQILIDEDWKLDSHTVLKPKEGRYYSNPPGRLTINSLSFVAMSQRLSPLYSTTRKIGGLR